MGYIDKNGTRIGPDDGKPDIVIPSADDINELRRIADASESRLKLAEQQAKAAADLSVKAERRARISLFIAIGAFLLSLATFVLKFFISGF